MRTSLYITSWCGIALRLHYTWLSLALLGVPLLMSGTLAVTLPDLAFPSRLTLALLVAALFFVSVVVHEVVHGSIASAAALPMDAVTLYPLGALTRLPDRRGDPWSAFWLAAAGPITSLGLWLFVSMVASDPRLPHWLVVVLSTVAQLNLVLGLITLLPGLPLDGGRMLRALLWGMGRSFEQATRLVSRLGLLLAYGLILNGAALVLWVGDWHWGGVLLLTGWLLLDAGGSIYRRAVVGQLLHRLTAGDVAQRPTRTVAPSISLLVCWELLRRQRDGAPLPVVDGELFCGLISRHQLLQVPRAYWATRTAVHVMTPAAALSPVTPDTPIALLISRLVPRDKQRPQPLPVVTEGRLVGLVWSEEVVEILEIEHDFGPEPQTTLRPLPLPVLPPQPETARQPERSGLT